MFRDEGIPVWDADAAVSEAYARHGEAVAPIEAISATLVTNGAVNRDALKAWLANDPQRLSQLEAVVHPIVADSRTRFLAAHPNQIVLLDIPLLFETGGDANVDAIVVVSTSLQNQKARVMDRGTMSEQEFETILARQMPDQEKRRRAHYLIMTDTLEMARKAVQECLSDIEVKRRA